MPFPVEVEVIFDKDGPLPMISFSVRGNVDTTSYTVAISSTSDPKRFVILCTGKKLDTPIPIKGPSVKTVSDLNERKIKWLIGLVSKDIPDAKFSLDVTFTQNGAPCKEAAHAAGNLQQGAELGYGFFDCTVR